MRKNLLLLTGVSLLLLLTNCTQGKLPDQTTIDRSFDLSYAEASLTESYSFQKNNLNNSISDEVDIRIKSLSEMSHQDLIKQVSKRDLYLIDSFIEDLKYITFTEAIDKLENRVNYLNLDETEFIKYNSFANIILIINKRALS